MVLLVGLVVAPLCVSANQGVVERLVNEYLELYKNSEEERLSYFEKPETLAGLTSQPHMALYQFGLRLTSQNKEHRLAAATALEILLKKKDFQTALKTNPDGEAGLKKRMVLAFQQKDPEMQNRISKAWAAAFPGANLYAAAANSQPTVEYNTALFYIHTGGVLLNPYTIKKDETGTFMLEDSGATEAHFFIEAMYRNRYAWQDKELLQGRKKGWEMDYEMRLGVASTNNDPSGAVVSGAGDAYMEFSVGKLIPGLNNIPVAKSQGVKWVTNAEALTGFVTDKGAQDLHFYWGIGPVVSVGIPYRNTERGENGRTIEVLGGIYFGQTDKPQFVDDDTRAVKSENDYPEFTLEWAAIWRGDIHFPMGRNGFLTIGGRFTSNLGSSGINPWNISIGYTIPVEVISDSVSRLFNQ
ncbi:MAG: hypothetical protein P8010_21280 [Desulfosarcinaceae bacterium]